MVFMVWVVRSVFELISLVRLPLFLVPAQSRGRRHLYTASTALAKAKRRTFPQLRSRNAASSSSSGHALKGV